jgi:hypothetical protein
VLVRGIASDERRSGVEGAEYSPVVVPQVLHPPR